MGPPESGLLPKRDAHFRDLRAPQRNTAEEKDPLPNRYGQRFPRPRGFPRKLHYIQWICTVVLFFFFMVLFQILLPGSTVEQHATAVTQSRLTGLEDRLELDLREQPGFDRSEFLSRLDDRRKGGSDRAGRAGARFGSRKPHLAMVFPDLAVDSLKILMVTLASALRDIGYEIQVYSLEDGPVRDAWASVGVAVTILQCPELHVDWSSYDGVMVNSIGSSNLYSEFTVEPFRDVPIIWTIHDAALAVQDGSKELFGRSDVVVFPTYELMRIYSGFDTGNFYPLLGSPAEECRRGGGGGHLFPSSGGLIIAIVRSQLVYRGFWLELALVLEALKPVVSFTKIAVVSGYSSGNHSKAVRAIAINLGFAEGVVEHYGDAGDALRISDVVIYASFVDEIVFPDLLIRAMCLGKVIVAPDLPAIRRYVTGYLFPKDDVRALRQIFLRIESSRNANRKWSSSATVKNANVLEAVQGYGLLLERVVRFPSEVFLPNKSSSSLELRWRWDLFEHFNDSTKTRSSTASSDPGVERGNEDGISPDFDYRLWEEEEKNEMARRRKSIEEDELKDRSDQPHGTWEEVYRNAKRADRLKNDLHERDDGELQRTGQTICIYEPYYGEGAWPFLHRSPLYRGIGLSTRGRRREEDDVDAPSRLSILNNSYYRDALGEYGAFFAIANRVDRLHKNPWIGFQSWRATARNASLSESASKELIDAIESKKHGDAFYFWIRTDDDRRYSPEQEFWSFCDAINAGNCRFAFIGAMKKMYGITWDFRVLPPMKSWSGARFGSWSVMHSWALPTRSFLELVMFSRMFVDALDSQFRDQLYCYLSMYKDKQCYSRVLELLVNVWAYHSARRMVYVDPMTGSMEEHHGLSGRRGHMWVKWFTYPTLKAMDEDLAEEWDLERPTWPWLWPSTGEVIWQGLYDRERTHRQMEKEKRRQRSKEKISRMRGRSHQKAIGKYVKPTQDVDTIDEFNSTETHR